MLQLFGAGSGPILSADVPFCGSADGPFRAGQQITDFVHGLASDVLQPSADVVALISPDRVLKGGHLNVQLLGNEEPTPSKIPTSATHLDDDAKAVLDPTFVFIRCTAGSPLQP